MPVCIKSYFHVQAFTQSFERRPISLDLPLYKLAYHPQRITLGHSTSWEDLTKTRKCITFISNRNLSPPRLNLTYGIEVSLTLLTKPGLLPDAIAIRNSIFNTSSRANLFFEVKSL